MQNINSYPLNLIVAAALTPEQREALTLLDRPDFRVAADRAEEDDTLATPLDSAAAAAALNVLHARQSQLAAANDLAEQAMTTWKHGGHDPGAMPAEMDKLHNYASEAASHAYDDATTILTAETVLAILRALASEGITGDRANGAVRFALFGS